MSAVAQNLMQQWAIANNIPLSDELRAGRLSLTIDRVRIHLLTLRSGEILVEARVRDLPSASIEQNQLLQKALALSTARMSEVAVSPVVDEAATLLKLQTRLAPLATADELDKTVSMVVNEVEFWRGVL
jgi:hypothetical protein